MTNAKQWFGFLFRNRGIRELEKFSALPLKNKLQLVGAYFSLCVTIAMLLHIMLKPIVPPASIVMVYMFSVMLFVIWSLCLLIPQLRKWNTVFTLILVAGYTWGQFYYSTYFSYQSGSEAIQTSSGGLIPLSVLDSTVIGLCTAILFLIGIGSSMYRKVVESQTEMKLQADAELKVAESIQRNLVPEIAINKQEIQIYGMSIPASVAGGDFVDCLSLSDSRYLAVIGDVSGHGLGAAITMAMVKSAFRTLADSFTSLDQLMIRLNRFVIENSSKQVFVSMSALLIEAPSYSFQYINAGHMPALVRSASGAVTEIEHKATALGITAQVKFSAMPFRSEAGSAILLYTDGINESIDQKGEEFGVHRIQNVFALSNDAAETGKKLFQELSAFSATVRDDRSLLCVYFTNPENLRK